MKETVMPQQLRTLDTPYGAQPLDAAAHDEHNNNLVINNLAIYDAQIVKDWRFYQALFPAFKAQVEGLLKDYKNLLCVDGSGVDDNFRNTCCKDKDGNRLDATRETF